MSKFKPGDRARYRRSANRFATDQDHAEDFPGKYTDDDKKRVVADEEVKVRAVGEHGEVLAVTDGGGLRAMGAGDHRRRMDKLSDDQQKALQPGDRARYRRSAVGLQTDPQVAANRGGEQVTAPANDKKRVVTDEDVTISHVGKYNTWGRTDQGDLRMITDQDNRRRMDKLPEEEQKALYKVLSRQSKNITRIAKMLNQLVGVKMALVPTGDRAKFVYDESDYNDQGENTHSRFSSEEGMVTGEIGGGLGNYVRTDDGRTVGFHQVFLVDPKTGMRMRRVYRGDNLVPEIQDVEDHPPPQRKRRKKPQAKKSLGERGVKMARVNNTRGTYPHYHVTEDGGILCPDCVDQLNPNRNHGVDLNDPQWNIVGRETHWEGNALHCDNCYGLIDSAYGPVGGD